MGEYADRAKAARQELSLSQQLAKAGLYLYANSPQVQLMNKAKEIGNAVANDQLAQRILYDIKTNPVVKSVTDYIYSKTPLEVANDVASVGSVAASVASPVTAPIGLARFIAPRAVPIVRGLVSAGREYAENVATDALTDELARNTALGVATGEDGIHIGKVAKDIIRRR